MNNQNIIIKIDKESIAYELGIEKGDILIHINNNIINDVFDYRYYIQDEYIEVGIKKSNGEEWLLEIEKDEYEDLGITFESGLMDKAKSCSNKCIFCFIDQLPKGMRKTLYFKDDDSRLSFLQGNYVTLTNMKKEDIDRIIFYHLSPINISVHTTDMELRKFMLKNPNAVNLTQYIKKFSDANIDMNFQVVLCKGVNDGKNLDKTINDLSKFIPHAKSLSIVPLGMTKYREGLFEFELFNKEDCINIIKQVSKWQDKIKGETGKRFVYVSDEFYLTAEMEFPNSEFYEGFLQLENGVGMISIMKDEFYKYFEQVKPDNKKRNITMVTGKASYNFIKELLESIKEKFENTNIEIYLAENDFFGHNITVSGLLTGQDIIKTLKNKKLNKYLFIPYNALKADEPIFLDNYTVQDLENKLKTNIIISPQNGGEFLKQILSLEE